MLGQGLFQQSGFVWVLGFPIKKMNGKVVWAFSIKKKKRKRKDKQKLLVYVSVFHPSNQLQLYRSDHVVSLKP